MRFGLAPRGNAPHTGLYQHMLKARYALLQLRVSLFSRVYLHPASRLHVCSLSLIFLRPPTSLHDDKPSACACVVLRSCVSVSMSDASALVTCIHKVLSVLATQLSARAFAHAPRLRAQQPFFAALTTRPSSCPPSLVH